MSYKATNWAWELPLKMPEKFVLIALADMADEQHSCYPGQATLAAMTGASERTVRRALVKLEEEGLLSREERRKGGGYRTSDRYVLKVDLNAVHYRPDWPVVDSHRSEGPVSPATQSILTGHSDRYIEEEPPENHQGTTSEPRKRGTRIPDQFIVTTEMWAWAAEKCPLIDGRRATEMFVNHFRAATGRVATKQDWPATWRNWLLKDQMSAEQRGPRSMPADRANDLLALGREIAKERNGDRKAIAS